MTYTPEQIATAIKMLIGTGDALPTEREVTLQCHVNALREALDEVLRDDHCNGGFASGNTLTKVRKVLEQTAPKESHQ